ncbi:hypothetical protein UVI_02044270 [Ustilaginoidea virens]|nr:hypothetical protein UVI_02044270 [Ustilaginoidea virens]
MVGLINGIPRRPRYAEHHCLIRSGSILIFEESRSGIKRWTDGLKWGPSRVLGNFLIYRELDDDSVTPVRKSAASKPRTSRVNRRRAAGISTANVVGSFGDWYQFKKDGLIKKTISVLVQDRTVHLVSYFTMEDIMLGRLSTPTMEPDLQNIIPRMELIKSESIRKPIDGADYLPPSTHSSPPSSSMIPTTAVTTSTTTTPTTTALTAPGWDPQQWKFLQHLSSYQPMDMFPQNIVPQLYNF